MQDSIKRYTTMNRRMTNPIRRLKMPARRGFTVIELTVVIAIIVAVLALLLPAMLKAREAARRTQCQNNLKQIILGLHNYAEQRHVFPPGVVDDQRPILQEPIGYHASWTVQLLPFLDQTNVSNGWDRSVGIYTGSNAQIFNYVIPVFACPSNSEPNPIRFGHPQSSYAGCYNDSEAPIDMTNVGVLTLNSSTRYEMIPDGTSHTIFIGEVRLPEPDVDIALADLGQHGLLGWASGTRATLRNTSQFNQELTAADFAEGDRTGPVGGFGSYHEDGGYFAFGDGSVRFLHDSIDPALLRDLGNPADGNLPSADKF
ncbi:hypothetical protein Mal52_03130 [Symmachiella dynata]|uniref:DUF1559 domain-containing protein n=2 Tax=Symmachiella dynata TaxID=2527995 RepID=A0A517ZHD4_9PLAN|nr:hypothetical protein Mal52_03130 [Symmachiella dynata]